MHPRRRIARCRWRVGDRWLVRARVERFAEPALLLLLAEGPRHGYDLLDQLPQLTADDRGADLGNVYRLLRALEDEGLVRSEWHAELPGPAKRVYEITDAGRELLAVWAEALRRTRSELDAFLERYENEEGR